MEVHLSTRNTSVTNYEGTASRHDFQSARGSVHFSPKEVEKTFSVRTIDDSIDDPGETLFVDIGYTGKRAQRFGARTKVAVARRSAKGTILNSDPLPAAWLARFGRAVAEQALEGITARMAAPRAPGLQGSIAGQAFSFGPFSSGRAGASPHSGAGPGSWSGANLAPGGETSAQVRGMTMQEVLRGASFSLTGEPDSAGGTLAFWGGTPGGGGLVSGGQFAGSERGDGAAVQLSGETASALLGTDYARGPWLVGFALSQTRAEGNYAALSDNPCSETDASLCAAQSRAGDGGIEASLTATIPYASYAVSDRLRLWGAVGQGAGDVTVRTDLGESLNADTAWSMAAAGLRGDLLAPSAEGAGLSLVLISDALWARTSSERTRGLAASESDVSRLRLGLEGSWGLSLSGGGTVTPSLDLGARQDSGDAETGFGVELGGGLKWVDPGLGLTLDLSARTLLAHDDGDLEDRGVSASLVFDPDGLSARGPSFSLGQDWGGRAEGGLDALFAPEPLEDSDGDAISRWALEAAYGLPAFGGRWTGSPYAGLGLDTGARDYSLGWRLTPEAANAPDLSFGVKATRRESEAVQPEHAVGVEITARW